MKYLIKIEFIHYIEVDADSDDEAFDLAYDSIPVFTSQLEDMSMDIAGKEE